MNLIQQLAEELSGEQKLLTRFKKTNYDDEMFLGTRSVSGQYWIFQPSSSPGR